MLAQTAKMPDQAGSFRGTSWRYERKFDGLRCIAIRRGGQVELWSRNHLSFNSRFAPIVRAVAGLGADDFTIDGELVAFDLRDGSRTTFAGLHHLGPDVRLAYCVFDVMHLLGHDTTGLPLEERADLLARVIPADSDDLVLVSGLSGASLASGAGGPIGDSVDPVSLLEAACRLGWEGLVAKRSGSLYRSGRSPDWRKLKCTARQEFVIGGWTDPSGARLGFGALLVGYFDEQGLRYAGRVGTGFDARLLSSLYDQLRSLAVERSPFLDEVGPKGVHWARPDLVAEVAYSEWTPDGRLRHPSFLGLRPDKDPQEVRLEPPS